MNTPLKHLQANPFSEITKRQLNILLAGLATQNLICIANQATPYQETYFSDDKPLFGLIYSQKPPTIIKF